MSTGGDAWHLLQSDLWARHKEAFGWRAVRVRADTLPFDTPDVLTLTRRLPGGVLFTYVPYGPAEADPAGGSAGVPGPGGRDLGAALADLVPRIAEDVRAHVGRRPTLVRFDLPQAENESTVGLPADYAAARRSTPVGSSGARAVRRAPVEVQPPHTVIIDLNRSEDELLAGMHKKNRYNIRLAARKDVRVRRVDATRLPEWYELYRETAVRDGIVVHSRRYYERLFELAAEDTEAELRLYVAEHEDELLAGIVVSHYRGGATYLYGASASRKRNLMPNYALQWHAVTQAREAGCRWYDLFGVPPDDDPEHPMHGLYRFKTGFGGALVHRLGAWDAPLRPVASAVYRVAERAREVYFHRVRRHGTR